MIDYTLCTYYRIATGTEATVSTTHFTDYFSAMKAYKTATQAIFRRSDAEYYVLLNENDNDDLKDGIYMKINTRTLKMEDKWLDEVIILCHDDDKKAKKPKKPKAYKPKKYKEPKAIYSDCSISDIVRNKGD